MRNIWKFVQYPTRLGEWVILGFLALCALPVLAIDDTAAARVGVAMYELCEVAPRHPVITSPEYRHRVAAAIAEAADEYDEDPLLLTAILFAESSFRLDVKGKRGERGLGQVHGVAARNCDLTSPLGQARCSARWLSMSRKACDGSDIEALARYVTKDVCRPARGGRIDRMVRYRLGIYKTISQM